MHMMPKRQWVVAVWSLLGAACNKDPRLGPLLPPCTASGDSVNLAVAAYVAVEPGADSGCIEFPANASGSPIEYLLVPQAANGVPRSEEHTSELQSLAYLVCRLLLEKKKIYTSS